MSDKKKEEESIRESDYYLSAVLTNKKSQGNLIAHSYVEQRKRRVNRSTHLLDVRSGSNMGESQLQKKGLSSKRCIKIKRKSQTCIEQMKITPFQNRKMHEKQTSQKKLTAINKSKDAPKQLQVSKQKWLIIQQLQASTTNLSVQRLLKQEIKRIKFGIQHMRQAVERQNSKFQTQNSPSIGQRTDSGAFNANQKYICPLINRAKMGKQKIKRSYQLAKKQEDYNSKIKDHLLKEMYQTHKEKDKLNNLCVSSQKYVLVNPETNASFQLMAKATVESSVSQKRTKHQRTKRPVFQVVNIYLHNSRVLKQREMSQLQVRPYHSQLHSNPLKKSRRKFENASGWEGGKRQQWEKQTYM